MTTARLALFFIFKTSEQAFSNTIPALWLGIRYDLREVGIMAVVMLLLGAIIPISPFTGKQGKRFWFILLSIFTFLLVAIYALDFAHYDYLHQRLNASILNFLEDAQISFGMMTQTYPMGKILLAVIAATFIVMYLVNVAYKVIARQPATQVTKRSTWIWAIIVFLIYGGGVYGHMGQYPLRWSDAFSLGDDRLSQLSLNPVQSFFSSLHFRHDTFDKKKVQASYKDMAAYLGVDHPDSTTLNFARYTSSTGNTTPPNIILVICESFSAYKSSMWGNPLNTTPYFNSMCQQGILFDHCFTPHFGTARGVWATITGIPDILLEKTASRNPSFADQHTVMNDIEGYEKYYFIGGSTSWANMRALLDNNIRGLHLYEQDKYDAPKVDVWGISDKNLFLQATRILKQGPKPFFAVIQTADNHRPYTIPNEDRNEFKSVQYPDDTLHKYGFERNDELNAFRYTDFSFRKFIEAAKKEPYFNNTVFVFVGDHGIGGDAANMFPKAWADLTCFHVPLLFYAPSMLAPARHTMICSQVDVMPTIAGITHKPYHNTTLGRDLLHLADTTQNTAFVIDHGVHQIGVVQGDYYYSRKLASNKEKLMSIHNNDPVRAGIADSLRQHMRQLTDAFYETARYMLPNNKKR